MLLGDVANIARREDLRKDFSRYDKGDAMGYINSVDGLERGKGNVMGGFVEFAGQHMGWDVLREMARKVIRDDEDLGEWLDLFIDRKLRQDERKNNAQKRTDNEGQFPDKQGVENEASDLPNEYNPNDYMGKPQARIPDEVTQSQEETDPFQDESAIQADQSGLGQDSRRLEDVSQDLDISQHESDHDQNETRIGRDPVAPEEIENSGYEVARERGQSSNLNDLRYKTDLQRDEIPRPIELPTQISQNYQKDEEHDEKQYVIDADERTVADVNTGQNYSGERSRGETLVCSTKFIRLRQKN